MVKHFTAHSGPKTVGHYSHATITDRRMYTSGMIALDPTTGKLIEGDVTDQAKQVLANLKAIIEEAGASLEKVVKCTIYLVDINDFPAVDAVYRDFFGDIKPARVTVAVSALPLGAKLEIDMIAKAINADSF